MSPDLAAGSAEELADWLAVPPQPGLWRWPHPPPTSDIEQGAGAAGWRSVLVDTRMRWDKAAFLSRCAMGFGFPSWFGHNWDALADALTDIDVPSPPGGLLVVWRGWGGMARQFPQDVRVATTVLTEAAQRWDGWGATMVIALAGPGPDLAPSNDSAAVGIRT